MLDEEIVQTRENEEVLPCLLKSFKKRRPQIFSRSSYLLAASQSECTPTDDTISDGEKQRDISRNSEDNDRNQALHTEVEEASAAKTPDSVGPESEIVLKKLNVSLVNTK